MNASARFLAAAAALLASTTMAQQTPNSLMGIHWYPNTDSISVGQSTDVEAMSNNVGLWLTEIVHVDPAPVGASPWVGAGYMAGHLNKAMTSKGHGAVVRIQPFWDCNVPHPDDPYQNAAYASDARAAAVTLKDFVRIWQVGNEVNIRGENRRWNAGSNNYSGALWEPTPAQYAATYIAVRDAIHDAATSGAPANPIVMMQAVSPGPTDAWRYMDGNEFLYRMIDAVADKSKIDGFGLHSYAEPGGTNYGADAYMDALREQIMIIQHFGLGDRPLIVTEFNKHMPNSTEAVIGANFLIQSYAQMHAWNTGSGGTWPGTPNQNIVGATWFVYPTGGWNDYALLHWKTNSVGNLPTQNPWYAFNHVASTFNYPAGAFGGGPTSIPANTLWWEDDFSGGTIRQTPPLPDWRIETSGGGIVTASGTGAARLRGNGGTGSVASLRTFGYTYSDFTLVADLRLVNQATSSGAAGEANFDIRVREGSLGYSLTFFTAGSNATPNTIRLRRASNWAENIGGVNVSVPGGITSGSTYRVFIRAMGDQLTFRVWRNGTTEVLNETVVDSGQVTGTIRVMGYNLNEVEVEHFALGGPDWEPPSSVEDWQLH